MPGLSRWLADIAAQIGRLVDWLGLRVAFLLIIGLTGFAILQPMIWTELLDREPPAGTVELASLVAVVVTIMSLGLAAFGVVVYQLVERRVQRDLEIRGEALRGDLEKRAARAVSRLHLNLSFQAFLAYDDMWKSWTPPYSPNAIDDPDFKALLGSALDNSEKALEAYEALPANVQQQPDVILSINGCKGNVAYFLATRCEPGDKKRALGYAKDIESESMSWQTHETVAWVRLRYGAPEDDVWSSGVRALGAFSARTDVPKDMRESLPVRYFGTFGERGDLRNALEGRLA